MQRRATHLLARLHALTVQADGLPPRALSGASTSGRQHACLESTRAVLSLEGKQAVAFLQGMVSNDVRPLEAAGAKPVYAILQSPKGKFLHDLMIYQHPESAGGLLLEVDKEGAKHALAWLERYKLRRPLQLRDASAEHRVWAAWGAGVTPQGLWHNDPRLPDLGLRALLPASSVPDVQALQGSEPSSADAYKALRCRLGVAEGEVEIPTGSAAPLEYNIDVLHGVSYTKGCYIGQERNSFTHYRGIIRKRLMPCTFGPGAAALQPGSEVKCGASGASVGHIRAVATCGTVGLVHLKLSAALPAAQGQGELLAAPVEAAGQGNGASPGSSGGAVRVIPVRPAWWSQDWGHEEDTAA